MDYLTPKTIEEALNICGTNQSTAYIAGGTDLVLLIFDRLKEPEVMIDITGISELHGIDATEDVVTLGSGTSMACLAASSDVPRCLSRGAASVGSPQIRSIATLGGNICNASPCGDTLPGLLVLDAVFSLQGSSGIRKVTAEEFFTGPKATVRSPEELLVSVEFSAAYSNGYSGFAKLGKRRGQVISQANAAVWFTTKEGTDVVEDIRIAAGSVAPVPIRLPKLEDDLKGHPLNDDMKDHIRQAAGGMVSPIDDVRASEWYRRGIMGTLIVRALEDAVQGGRT